jgi:hypothetical protein
MRMERSAFRAANWRSNHPTGRDVSCPFEHEVARLFDRFKPDIEKMLELTAPQSRAESLDIRNERRRRGGLVTAPASARAAIVIGASRGFGCIVATRLSHDGFNVSGTPAKAEGGCRQDHPKDASDRSRAARGPAFRRFEASFAAHPLGRQCSHYPSRRLAMGETQW